MNLLHLKYAVEVEKTGSITQAASNLYMNQPHLSKAIRELEETVGFAIFNRTPRGMVPTRKGEEFLRHAKGVLAQVRELESLYRRDGTTGVLEIAAPPLGYVAVGIAAFLQDKTMPTMEIHCRTGEISRVLRMVENSEIDWGLVSLRHADEEALQVSLADRELMAECLARRDEWLLTAQTETVTEKTFVTENDLSGWTEIVVSREAAEESKNVGKRPLLTVPDRAAAWELLRRVPQTFMKTEKQNEEDCRAMGLRQWPLLNGEALRSEWLITRRSSRLTPEDRRLIARLREAAREE